MEGSNVIKKTENRKQNNIDQERKKKKTQKPTTLIFSSLSDIQGKMAPRMSA